ncbi:MAG: iron-containing alcohol dehydrogenase [Candidatus Omnitrophica bacterium]|nr:iron-containing alcohol dehydrogenase [Candidatus Omnitrophota bacterium]
MNFQFYTPTQIVVGRGESARAGDFAASLGQKAFVVMSRSLSENGAAKPVLDSLAAKKISCVEYIKPPGEPTVETADDAARQAAGARCDLVLSLGGGAVIDLAKAAAGLASNGGAIQDYLEGVGKGLQITRPALPHIALPSTAGAGAEMTRNAVIRSQQGRFKKSFRSPHLYPTVAILDAQLSLSLPPQQTAYSGMDAITQLIESYISRRATPLTDALALYGLERALFSIREVYKDGSAVEHRENMLLASSLSGLCLANAGLGMAHGFASGLGALYDAPHGKVCAVLLPHAVKFNRCAQLDKLARIGRLLTGDASLPKGDCADLLIQYLYDLNREFGIPADLREFNIPKDEHPLLIKMSMGNSMSGNPITITENVARTILEALS